MGQELQKEPKRSFYALEQLRQTAEAILRVSQRLLKCRAGVEKYRTAQPQRAYAYYLELQKTRGALLAAFGDAQRNLLELEESALAGKAGQRAREMVAHGAHGIMTGTPDAGSLSAEMLKNGQMLFLRYPVHLDAMQCRELAEKNQFGRVIPYHSPEIDCPCFFLL